MKVVLHRRAARYLQRLPAAQQESVKARLRTLASDPAALTDVQDMKGDWAGYQRLRIGSLRVIFLVDREQQLIHVDHIGPRGDVYK
jgi:mRNA interferase RelE/StbE